MIKRVVNFCLFFAILSTFELNLFGVAHAEPAVGICINRGSDGNGGWVCSNPKSTLKPVIEFSVSENYPEADYWVAALDSWEGWYYFDLATMKWRPGL